MGGSNGGTRYRSFGVDRVRQRSARLCNPTTPTAFAPQGPQVHGCQATEVGGSGNHNRNTRDPGRTAGNGTNRAGGPRFIHYYPEEGIHDRSNG